MRRLLAVPLLALFLAAPAQASWFPAATVDGGASAFGGLDVARDGSAALTYVKSDGHVYVARMANGAWQAPERADAGEDQPGTDPVVAVADGGAVLVAWRSADRILAAASEDGGPLGAPVAIGQGDVGPPDVDMAIQRTGYVVFRQAGDVRAVRLRQGAWESAPAPMDIDPADDAGAGAGRPRVATAADGNALVVWGEHGDLFARRLTDLRLSVLPQEIAPGADSADVAIEDDVSFAWVAYRQDIDGASRVFARRLVGSLFEDPKAIDLGPGSRAPRISMNGDGAGIVGYQRDDGAVGIACLAYDVFGSGVEVGLGSGAVVAESESADLAVAWQGADGFVGRHVARLRPIEPEVALGAGSGPADMGADRAGDMVLAWLQGDAIAAAAWDEAPGRATLRTNRGYKAIARPLLRWGAGLDLWGAQRFRVLLDGKVLTTTTDTSVTAPTLTEGPHRWQVISVDLHGQETAARARYVRVDLTAPSVAVRRLAGRRVAVTIADRRAGVKSVLVGYGDGSSTTLARPPVHRYARKGSYRVSVRAEDNAGNVARRSLTVHVR